MSFTDQILQAIKDEITNDPERRGYAGKTDDDIAGLLNESYTAQVSIQQKRPSRMSQIIANIPFLPNAAAQEDVTDAKAL